MASQTLTQIAVPQLALNTGRTLPAVGFGLWKVTGNQAKDAVKCALAEGYRHIDTAFAYGNEKEVGEAIRESGVPRSEIFVTTKIWNYDHHNPEAALDKSLETMGLDYIDLLLIHTPVAFIKDEAHPENTRDLPINHDSDYRETWAKMEAIPTSKARAIGVSNLTIRALDELLQTAKRVPAVNQVEMHPNLPIPRLVDYCKSKGIAIAAYSPLAQGQLSNPVLTEIGNELGVSPATVALSWGVQRGTAVLPKSVTPERIRSNLVLIELSPEQMQRIDAIGTDLKRFNDLGKKYGVNMFDNESDSLVVA